MTWLKRLDEWYVAFTEKHGWKFGAAALIGGIVLGYTVSESSLDQYWEDFYEKGDPNDISKSMFRQGYADCLENKQRLYQGY